MDDEVLIRNSAGDLLKALEHEVDFAACGEEAIEKYRSARETGKPFDIVILDLTIRGGMGGRETIERLLAIDPGIRAIVSSGYLDGSGSRPLACRRKSVVRPDTQDGQNQTRGGFSVLRMQRPLFHQNARCLPAGR